VAWSRINDAFAAPGDTFAEAVRPSLPMWAGLRPRSLAEAKDLRALPDTFSGCDPLQAYDHVMVRHPPSWEKPAASGEFDQCPSDPSQGPRPWSLASRWKAEICATSIGWKPLHTASDSGSRTAPRSAGRACPGLPALAPLIWSQRVTIRLSYYDDLSQALPRPDVRSQP